MWDSSFTHTHPTINQIEASQYWFIIHLKKVVMKKKKKGNVVIVIVLIANVTSPFVSESDEMVFRLFKIGLDYPLMGFQIGL